MKLSRTLIVLSCAYVLAACEPEARGFKLPAGDIPGGKAAFVDLGCNDCHSVADLMRVEDSDTGFNLPLGGPVTQVKTYGELVTSIINPSHKIARRYSKTPISVNGESRMRRYNEVMTVQQLVDLVTFLETQYDLLLPHPNLYL